MLLGTAIAKLQKGFRSQILHRLPLQPLSIAQATKTGSRS